jgi:NAD(P)-dependent dehydrogenase (short-subunit alcohol dehydrogenase family)
MALPLEDKVAIVTGSSRGIGKAAALALARDGADVVVCARSESGTALLPGSIGETAAEIESLGRRALALRLDVANEADIRAAVERVLAEMGRIDIVVNNAATLGREGGNFLDGDPSFLQRSFLTNVYAPFLISHLVAPKMAATGGGTIINISSGAAHNPPPPTDESIARVAIANSPVYGITKAALNRFATGVASELYRLGVAIIALDPGFIATERATLSPMAWMDLSRAESPDVPARAIALLCRSGMSFTGQVLTAHQVLESAGVSPDIAAS